MEIFDDEEVAVVSGQFATYIFVLLHGDNDLGRRCGRHALHSLTLGRLKLQLSLYLGDDRRFLWCFEDPGHKRHTKHG